MKLRINAETMISLDFDISHEGNKLAGTIHMDGGEWFLNIGGRHEYLAGKRVEWPEALKRALVRLDAKLRCGGR